MRINTGDAQGYVSWKRYKQQLKQNGLWTAPIKFISDKVDKGERITPNEVEQLFNPLKRICIIIESLILN